MRNFRQFEESEGLLTGLLCMNEFVLGGGAGVGGWEMGNSDTRFTMDQVGVYW
jgi:hypothetical protein